MEPWTDPILDSSYPSSDLDSRQPLVTSPVSICITAVLTCKDKGAEAKEMQHNYIFYLLLEGF